VLAVVPTGTLGAQAARSRGVVAVLPSRNAPSRAPGTTGAAPAASSGADAANAAPGSALAPVPDLTVLDIVYAVASADYAAKVGLSQGAPVKLLGLVVKGGPGSPADGFVLTRFLVTCCVADAVPIGVRVTGPGAAGFADNTWVIVEGALTWQKATGLVKPGQVLADIAVTKIEPTAAPADAYVY
jgi:uncharacterized repeat protein (TIGR03943 family)